MSCTVDARGFLAFLDAAVQHVGGVELDEKVLRPEIGKVLDVAVRYTPSTSAGELQERVRYTLNRKYNTYAAGEVGSAAKSIYPHISNAPGKGNKWWVDNNAQGKRTFYIMNRNRRWSDARWAAYQREEAERIADLATQLRLDLPKARGARGLKKQSWVQIGNALGIPVEAPAYAVAAAYSSGKNYVNGSGSRTVTPDGIVYELRNVMPALVQRDGADILQRALNARQAAIETAFRTGIFDSLEATAKRFPGIALAR